MRVIPTDADLVAVWHSTYHVQGPDEPDTAYFTTRREAFREVRLRSLACGEASVYDPLTRETFPYFDGRPCCCTAEARLLRAIFNEAHPTDCEVAGDE